MIITLLTDFGTSDSYVAIIKGVILGISSQVSIVDITHSISPHDVDEAGLMLQRSYSYFPENTIHVVVVDPGVGSSRAVLAVKTNRHIFLAPDNGVLQPIFIEHPDAEVYQITNEQYFLKNVSTTFHGRDVFAPVAAHLANGVELLELGELFENYYQKPILKPEKTKEGIIGIVTGFDHFGNVLTNIGSELLPSNRRFQIHLKSGVVHNICRTYSEVPVGEVLGLIGSSGVLEISVNKGNAREHLLLSKGDPVVVKFKSNGESIE